MKYVHILILFLVASAPALYNFAFAEECKQVCVNKQFYTQGDAVIISGKVDAVLQNTPLLIQVIRDSDGTKVHIAQIDVAQDGTYTDSFKADGPYFTADGKYIVKTLYGVTGNVFETSFEFQTSKSAQQPGGNFEVKAGDSGTFDVPYAINGGSLKNIIVDPSILGLVVTIQADSDGSITLDLGRKWIDAKIGADGKSGQDDKYIVYIDGAEVQYQESSTNPDSRLLTIQFEEGDSDIEIIGTYVVPEFGPVAVIVLVAAIASVMIVTRRNSILQSI